MRNKNSGPKNAIKKNILIEHPLKAALSTIFDLTNAETQAINDLPAKRLTASRNETLIDMDSEYHGVFIVESGWCSSSRILPDGRRQILQFAIPSDFIGIESIVVQRSTFEVRAMTDASALLLSNNVLSDFTKNHPRIMLGLVWKAARDESMLAERLVSVGRRSAFERLAHFFVEMWARMETLGFIENDSCPFPATKEDLADAMGLTTIHIYRTLKRLSSENLIQFDASEFKIIDIEALKSVAQYDESYLRGPRFHKT